MDNKDVTYVLTDGSVKQIKEEAVQRLYKVITSQSKKESWELPDVEDNFVESYSTYMLFGGLPKWYLDCLKGLSSILKANPLLGSLCANNLLESINRASENQKVAAPTNLVDTLTSYNPNLFGLSPLGGVATTWGGNQ